MATTVNKPEGSAPLNPDRPASDSGKPKAAARPRRTLNQLALALAGLLIAALGQYFFSRESLWDGFLFMGCGVILFTAALLPRLPGPLPAQPTRPSLQSGWRGKAGIWLILLALGLSYLTYTFFGNENARLQAWWLYLGSLGCVVAGGLLVSRGEAWREVLRRYVPPGWVGWTLLAIVLLALFMRLYRFDSQPAGIWFDEAEAGLQARQMLAEPSYRPVLYPPINITGHLLALYALALNWFGDTLRIQSMRLVSVAFGLGAVIAAYLFGRELRGPRFGLVLAFLMAVARWPVNFSRIAMTGIDTPFFELLTLFFLARWLHRRNPRDALWTGLSLGFGLMFYTAFRLFVLGLVIFGVIALLLWTRHWLAVVRRDGWLPYAGQIALAGLAVWLVVLPLVQFALDNPQAFWYRTNQISIFTKRDQADVSQALWETTRKHLLMFNVAGDKNGRHNLPGKPMLDPAMGVLWLLGLGLVVTGLVARRATPRPFDLLFVILFGTALVGGIFSVDFEAPQSLRSIAVIPVVVYFCGVAVAAVGRELEESFRPLPQGWVITPAVALAAFVFYSNASTYFIDQSRDFASWNAFSTPETIVGQKMAELGPDTTYLLSPFFSNHPAIRFLAPNATDQQPLVLPDALPIRRPAERPVTLFIHPDDEALFSQAQQLYPNAKFEIANSQTVDERPVVYMVNLQPDDIASLQGLTLNYLPADVEPGVPVTPLQFQRVMNVDVTWPDAGPAQIEDFAAEWSGTLYAAQYGVYNFRLVAPDSALLEIDGHPVLTGQGEQQGSLVLAEGNHAFWLRAEAGRGPVQLFWQPPGFREMLIPQWAFYAPPITNHGLLGTFYANDSWSGQPVLQRIDPKLDTYFHLIPMQRPYSVEWTGWLDAPQAGVYRLGLRAVQEAEIYLDGTLLVVTAVPNEFIDAPITLEAGLHEILVRYKDTTDRSRIHLSWTRPNGQMEPIPSQNLWPPSGRPPQSVALQTPVTVETGPLTLEWQLTLGGLGAEPGQFSEPRDVAVLSNGNLVVADTANRRVQLLDAQGNFITSLTGDDLPFEEPLAVGVNSRDEILVLDSTLQWVYRYSAEGIFLDRFGGPAALLFHPRGMTVLADDSVALADTGTGTIKFFNPDGSRQGQIGSVGSSPGQFGEPTDVLRDAQGTYFVAEADTNRIQRVDVGGQSLNLWAIPPTYAFNGPHLAAGPDGSLFVTEVQSQSLLRYAPDGNLLDQWSVIGPVTLIGPVGIYLHPPTNQLFITDVSTHQVHIFTVRVGG